jgi:hypothetical protein
MRAPFPTKTIQTKEQNMQNKKLILIMGVFILLVGGAAFIAGRMINQKSGLVEAGGLPGSNNGAFAIQLAPAKELPQTPPEVTGSFVERKDNTIVVASAPLEASGGGIVLETGGGEEGPEGLTSKELPSGPKVEIVVTSDTTIYRDTTDFSEPPSSENAIVQETVGEGTLDDLNSDSMVRVWGRKSGDRIIADILFYSSPVVMKSPGAQ